MTYDYKYIKYTTHFPLMNTMNVTAEKNTLTVIPP